MALKKSEFCSPLWSSCDPGTGVMQGNTLVNPRLLEWEVKLERDSFPGPVHSAGYPKEYQELFP